jgi:hypothetical protein
MSFVSVSELVALNTFKFCRYIMYDVSCIISQLTYYLDNFANSCYE